MKGKRLRTTIKGRLKAAQGLKINEKKAGEALAKLGAVLSLLAGQWDKGHNSAILSLLYPIYYEFHDAGMNEEVTHPMEEGD